ncbi:MAG TPA: hypothetical protein VN690_09005 [Terriglobales bacterium]|nr:hypothetical protein [Terriglobales bacterium]
MKLRLNLSLSAAALALALSPLALRAIAAPAPAKPAVDTTYTGIVGDDMCGVKHTMGGSDTDCTHMCVSGGSNYALIVGQKAYTLATTDKTALATLNRLAGKRAVVKGTLAGTTLTVHSVAPAGK